MYNKLPQYVKTLLWDVNLEKFDYTQYPKYVIERILEYGDLDSIKWMEQMFSREQIKETLKKSKRISIKSGNFFSLIYNTPKEELECFKKPYSQKQLRF